MTRTDDELRRLLHDAVADVEPAERLGEIRARTGGRRRRPALVGAVAVLATAAAVAAIVVGISNVGDRNRTEPAPPTPDDSVTVPLYFVGDTPQGPRLFRELRTIPATEPLVPAGRDLLMKDPLDPDYRTLWGPGSFQRSMNMGSGGPPENLAYLNFNLELEDPALTRRPAGMSTAEARLAVQQLIYSLHEAYLRETNPISGEPALAHALPPSRLSIDFRYRGKRVPILGIPYDKAIRGASSEVTLAQVSIDEPGEGDEVHGGALVARGRANSFEANVPWHVLDADGNRVLDGFTTATGWGDRLYPWRSEIDVSGLEPGTYTFVAQTDDPSGGTEGAGPHTDTRTIVIE